MNISIATVNVNGIRAAFRKGFSEWLASRQPDILLLQETRAPAEVVADCFGEGWHVHTLPSVIKGRAGVAIVSRLPITETRLGLSGYDDAGEPPVDSGRWLEADIALPLAEEATNAAVSKPSGVGSGGLLTVVSAYFHSATNTPEMAHTMVAKYAHLDKIEARLRELVGMEHPVIVGGDFNIAHQNVDLANWKGNKNSAGFLPEEREYLTRWFTGNATLPDAAQTSGANATPGWTDLGRHHAGEVEGPYTWWGWRGQAFTNDRGWRIDYQAGNPAATQAVRSVMVDRQPTYEQRYTDHAPVIAEFEL
jgi:exodeoxyribonuclease-3